MIFTIIRRSLRAYNVRNARKTADDLAKNTGKKHYVIQIHKKLEVLNRVQIDYLIDCKCLHKRLRTAYELQKIAVYTSKSGKNVPDKR